MEIPYEKGKAATIETNGLVIGAYPVNHRIPCFAYSFTLPRPGKFDAARAKEQGIPLQLWSLLQKGEPIEHDGRTYTPDMVLGSDRRPIKVSYCTDTKYVQGLSSFISESDLFICEGLYGEDDKSDKAKEHYHMTFREAAVYAKEGNAGELWLTHFSPALTDPENHVERLRDIFPDIKAGRDRMTKTLRFKD